LEWRDVALNHWLTVSSRRVAVTPTGTQRLIP
jgi:hypothetical protein